MFDITDNGGKQWQTTPKNLPRMQRTRAIPVTWLSSGLCPNQPKGWIPIIIIIITDNNYSQTVNDVSLVRFHRADIGMWPWRIEDQVFFFYIWVSVHHKSIIYNKPTRCKSGIIVFINNYMYNILIKPSHTTKYVSLSLLLSRTTCYDNSYMPHMYIS